MLTFLMFVGVLLVVGIPLIVAALFVWYGLNNPDAGAGKLVYKYWPFGMPQSVQERQRVAEREATEKLREATRVVPMQERLRKIQIGQFLTMMGDQVDVTGFITLLELQYFGADKSQKVHVSPRGEKLREFPWYILGDGRAITEIPVGEGKRLAWFLAEDVTDKVDIAVAEFMSGPPNGRPGPAKEFAMSNQSAHVVFSVPGISGSWKAKDIVWADCEIKGANSHVGNGARLAMFLAQEGESENYLLFADLRSGSGSDTLWLLQPFNPNVEIENIL